MKIYNQLRTVALTAFLLGIIINLNAQITSGDLVNIHDVDNVTVTGLTGMDTGSLVYNKTSSSLQVYNGTTWNSLATSSSWNLTGNTGVTASNFIGSLNDIAFNLRANNVTTLQLGRRQTLGLYDGSSTGVFPYNDADQALTFIRGNNGESALQFEATGALFYKPIFFTDSDGNFKMRGSSAGTDFFEIGSAGTSNNGSLEFVIGDDGNEPIIFKKYNYTTQTYIEMMRLQGTGLNTTVRAGIGTAGVVPNSTFQVAGSFANNISTLSTATTLDDSHHTIILTNNSGLTLPAASSCLGREYIIKKTNIGTSTISSYRNYNNASTTSITRGTYHLQSDGSSWHELNPSPISSDANNKVNFGSDGRAFVPFAVVDSYDATTSTTSQLASTTATTLNIGNTRTNLGSVFTVNTATNTISISDTGVYKITYSGGTRSINNSEISCRFYLENGTTEIPDSEFYTHGYGGSYNSSSRTVILYLVANTSLRIRYVATANSSLYINNSSTGLVIERLQ